MRILTLVAVVAASLSFVPSGVSAQSLAEAAKKEKERRKHLKPSKVYTDADLRNGGGMGGGEAATTAAKEGEEAAAAKDGEKPGAPKARSEEEVRADQEKEWRERLQTASKEVARLTTVVDTLQLAVNDMSQNVYGANRTNQLNRLAEAKQLLADGQQKVETLQDEGRRNQFH